MQYKKTTLPNGLRIITVPMKSTETVSVVVMVGVGSRYESEKDVIACPGIVGKVRHAA